MVPLLPFLSEGGQEGHPHPDPYLSLAELTKWQRSVLAS